MEPQRGLVDVGSGCCSACGWGHSQACSLGLGLLRSNIYSLLQLGVSQSLHAPSRCWQPCAIVVRNRGWGSAWG